MLKLKNDTAKILTRLNLIASIFILVLSYFFVCTKLFAKESLTEVLAYLSHLPNQTLIVPLLILLSLMLLNWSLEAVKWKFLMKKVLSLSFFRSLQSTWLGVCVGFIFPNRTGDFIGRGFSLPQGYALKGSIATFVGNFAQGIITLLMGMVGAMFYFFKGHVYQSHVMGGIVFLTLLLLLIVFCLWAYFKITSFTKFLQRFNYKWIENLVEKLQFLNEYSVQELLRILFLSWVRYLVFLFQLYWSIHIFSGSNDILTVMLLGNFYFLLTTIIPTWVLSEVGVRSSVAILIFGQMNTAWWSLGLENLFVVASTIVLWLVNVVIPAIIGSFSVFRLKIFR